MSWTARHIFFAAFCLRLLEPPPLLADFLRFSVKVYGATVELGVKSNQRASQALLSDGCARSP
jgi:hypothetical protein